MCGRITRTSPREAIAKEFGATRFAEVDWHPRYNVTPSHVVETISSVKGKKRLGDALGLRLGHGRGAEDAFSPRSLDGPSDHPLARCRCFGFGASQE